MNDALGEQISGVIEKLYPGWLREIQESKYFGLSGPCGCGIGVSLSSDIEDESQILDHACALFIYPLVYRSINNIIAGSNCKVRTALFELLRNNTRNLIDIYKVCLKRCETDFIRVGFADIVINVMHDIRDITDRSERFQKFCGIFNNMIKNFGIYMSTEITNFYGGNVHHLHKAICYFADNADYFRNRVRHVELPEGTSEPCQQAPVYDK